MEFREVTGEELVRSVRMGEIPSETVLTTPFRRESGGRSQLIAVSALSASPTEETPFQIVVELHTFEAERVVTEHAADPSNAEMISDMHELGRLLGRVDLPEIEKVWNPPKVSVDRQQALSDAVAFAASTGWILTDRGWRPRYPTVPNWAVLGCDLKSEQLLGMSGISSDGRRELQVLFKTSSTVEPLPVATRQQAGRPSVLPREVLELCARADRAFHDFRSSRVRERREASGKAQQVRLAALLAKYGHLIPEEKKRVVGPR